MRTIRFAPCNKKMKLRKNKIKGTIGNSCELSRHNKLNQETVSHCASVCE
ncbi:hypothetical protein BACCELL_04770 [Bacteroides cellulosilyticus DSM 14838]|uniref:Uncharacterized protein n=1 Tax=Bacteroides cellulosilyticus DSM 14838 TaxID=537012 RepID=E2NKC9_9BACE|nr:hypothetical protein BACCELL_04770 [Bacteroides cellulosilyticus DSM 14838]